MSRTHWSAVRARLVLGWIRSPNLKSPSFSGIGASAHYLTIENQETSRRQAIKAEIKAYQEDLAREADNTTLARFIRNLESRIYAQLSRQLVDNLFGETANQSGILKLENGRSLHETYRLYTKFRVSGEFV